MAEKKLTYFIEVNTENSEVKINGVTRSIGSLSRELQNAGVQADRTGKKLGQVTDKTGLAGAAVVELGRTVSDANYGFTAMANNISQLATLFTTLIATTGGLTAGLRAMWAALMGPLGLIVAFQIVVAVLEHFALSANKATQEVDSLTKSIDEQIHSLKILSDAYIDAFYEGSGESVLGALLKDFKEFKNAYEGLTEEEKGSLLTVNALVDRFKALLQVRREIALVEGKINGGLTPLELVKAQQQLIELKAKEYEMSLEFEKKAKAKASSDPKGRKAKDSGWLFMPGQPGTYDQITTADFEFLEQMMAGRETWLNFVEAQTDTERELALQRIEDARIEAETKAMLWDGIGLSFEAMGDIIGRETEAGKFVAAAGALISTYAAIAGQLAAFAKVPIPGYAIAQAIATGAVGFAQVAQIYRTNTKGKNSGAASGGSTPAAQITPQFNIIGSTGPNRIGEAVREAIGDRPVRAYVTTKDIKSGQELDRNTRSGASI